MIKTENKNKKINKINQTNKIKTTNNQINIILITKIQTLNKALI
jgi:hypothetical protein